MRKQFRRLYAPGKHDPSVYFVQYGNRRPIKIGYTTDIGVRLAILGAAHYKPITLLVAALAPRKMETDLHRAFSQERLGDSEWFLPTRRLLAFVRGLARYQMCDKLRRSIEIAKGVDIDLVFLGTQGNPLEDDEGRPVAHNDTYDTG